MFISFVMTALGLAILLSAVLWAINKLAPEPIKTWGTVVVVVIAACYVAAVLMGYTPVPILLHR